MKALLLLSLTLSALAQNATTPAFEVATIKPTPNLPPPTPQERLNGTRPLPGMDIAGDRVNIRELGLRFSIGQAYRVRPIYVFGEDWLDTKFDISAKMPDGSSPQQMPDMLRTLLADRFGLRVHTETRAMPIYVLKVAKSGPKLKEASPDAPNGVRNAPGQMINVGTLDSLGAAGSFAGLRDPLVNETGLTGRYEVPLDPQLIFGNMTNRSTVDDSDAVARMQEALAPSGLTIERARVPAQVVVVDHIDHTPKDN